MALSKSYPISSGRGVGSKIIGGERVPEVVDRPSPGVTRSFGNEVDITVANAATLQALIGIRAQPAFDDLTISLTFASVIVTSNDRFEWRLYFNPTISGAFSYTDLPDSKMQVATGSVANIITDGIIAPRGFGQTQAAIQAQFANELEVGATQAELVLAVRTFSQNSSFQGSLVWRELAAV